MHATVGIVDDEGLGEIDDLNAFLDDILSEEHKIDEPESEHEVGDAILSAAEFAR